MKVLIVDDESLARLRLQQLLQDLPHEQPIHIQQAASAHAARQAIAGGQIDLVFLDIHMPSEDGMSLGRWITQQPFAPAVVFVTAHAEHALQAFDIQALDYLTKPVRAPRLAQAMQRWHSQQPKQNGPSLLILEKGRALRVPLDEVIYLKAEQKYITVRTGRGQHLLEGSLLELESQHPQHLLRIHRNALVSRWALRKLEMHHGHKDEDEGTEGWLVHLEGASEPLAVSRRQLAAVREAMRGLGM